MNNVFKHTQLYNIAENQAGYFTAQQAHLAGFSRERISYYVKYGRFSRIRRGIYRLVQFPASPNEDLFVAWLITGRNSVISHESALSLYELSDILPGEIHVIMPRTGSRRRKGIRLHTNQLMPDEITQREGLPVTNVARTIIDVASSGIAEEHLIKAIFQALSHGLVNRDELLSMASRRGNKIFRLIKTILDSLFL